MLAEEASPRKEGREPRIFREYRWESETWVC
jgi:hypothetical protein